MTDIVQPPRSKRARRTKTLETWLKGRGVDEPEALREACLYASTIDELATAPPEDMDWLTEAWDPRVRSVFLDAVNEARSAIEQGRKPEGAPDEYYEPLPPISAEAVASTLAGMPSQPAAPPPPPTPPKLDSKRSEAHKGAAPRFRMSILTDYAGVVSETVTDERLPAHVEGEENNEDNLEFRR